MLTEIQNKIVTAPLGAAIVTAGAGSGKTRVLTHRIAHIINNGTPDTAIMAVTFTNKAAAEMKHRIEKLLGYTCNAYLGTFHAWCARFLRKYIKPPFNSNFTIYDSNDTKKLMKQVEHDVDAYKQKLAQSNALDFEDLLDMTLDILKSDKEIREYHQNEIQYILVDEFQDTNKTQYNIVSILAASHKNIMVVGDEDQCIYSWRGASIDNLDRFRRDFPNCQIFKLEQNFRSSKNIVDLANTLVNYNENRLDKVLFSKLADGEIQLKKCYDEREEARNIALMISSEIRSGLADNYRDFAILIRLNALSKTLEEQFRMFNIPHVIWGGFKFYERAEIKSTLNYLRILANPRDEVALIDIINWPRRGIGESTISKLRLKTTTSLFDTIQNIDKHSEGLTAKTISGIRNFNYAVNNLREIYQSFGLGELAGNLISTVGLDNAFKTDNEEDLSRLENIHQLIGAIGAFATENPSATLDDYLQTVSLDSGSEDVDRDSTVIISTIHSAKGLEFKNVFVIGLEEGLFPLVRQNASTDIEEERRLLYVAMTRARKNLYLSYCDTRFYQGTRNYRLPSIFLKESGLKTKAPENNIWQNKPWQNKTQYPSHQNTWPKQSNFSSSARTFWQPD